MYIEQMQELYSLVRYYEPQYQEDIEDIQECPGGVCQLSAAELALLDDEGEF